MKNVVIAGYARSPFALAHKGKLAKMRPDELSAQVVTGLVEKTGVKTADIEDLIIGCAFPEGEQGLNMARYVALRAELPITVAGATINRFCGSSMYAIHMAAGAIQMGAGETFICAGVESMTRVPMGGYNPMPNPGLYKSYPEAYASMGETAENVAARYQIGREAQEAFAVESQAKAAATQAAGKLDDEIVAITHDGARIDKDGCIRPDTTAEGLAELLLAAFLAERLAADFFFGAGAFFFADFSAAFALGPAFFLAADFFVVFLLGLITLSIAAPRAIRGSSAHHVRIS